MATAQGVRGVLLPTAVAAAALVALVAQSTGAYAVSPSAQLPLWSLNVVPVVLGWLVARRAPGSPVTGPLAWTGAGTIVAPVLKNWALTHGTPAPWPGSALAARVGTEGFWAWQLVAPAWLLLVFPAGLLPGRRWRAPAACVPSGALLVSVAFWGRRGEPVGGRAVVLLAAAALLLLGFAAAVVGLVERARSGDEQTRLQLRWLTLAGGCVPVLLALGWLAETLGASVSVAYAGFVLAIVVLVPLAVAVAVVRHDLFDVDRLLGESVTWLLTTVVSAAVFAGVVLAVTQAGGRRLPAQGASPARGPPS